LQTRLPRKKKGLKNAGFCELVLYTVLRMGRGFNVTRLSDEFGQYLLYLKCSAWRSRAANLPQSVGSFVRVGRPIAVGGKAPAMFQMRQEALPDSFSAAAKAARHSALPLI
jgi:hypothetical protein